VNNINIPQETLIDDGRTLGRNTL